MSFVSTDSFLAGTLEPGVNFAAWVDLLLFPIKTIGDHGWTYRHDIGRQQVEEAYGDKVETAFVESVPEGPDAERVMRQMAKGGADIIFATSFGYMQSMLNVAKEFPDTALILGACGTVVAVTADDADEALDVPKAFAAVTV